MNGFENDADMKIVGDERPAAIDTAAKWQQQKACGNIDRAHRLGAVLAQQLMNIEEPDAARLLQKQMLLAFVVDDALPSLLPDELLTKTVRGTFYERLRGLLPDFEDTLHRLGAFTFYRLSVDGDAPDAVRVGAVFAALCGCAEDAAVEKEGARLYRGYHERLAETVAMVDFQSV